MNPRETRLADEFKRMLSIRRPGGLIDFNCGDLSDEEAYGFLAPSISREVIEKGLQQFLTPEEYMRRYPGQSPEKYLVRYRCKGLKKLDDGQVVPSEHHLLEVVLGPDYPLQAAPRFVWLTPIWHPNILGSYLCTEGRPFAISTTLDMICLMVGQMIQYRNFNVHDALNKEAAAWAEAHREEFPLDDRGLLDGRQHGPPLVTFVGNELVELPTQPAEGRKGGDLVQLL
jgi:hypothetical protein